jgi:hypothetical protein
MVQIICCHKLVIPPLVKRLACRAAPHPLHFKANYFTTHKQCYILLQVYATHLCRCILHTSAGVYYTPLQVHATHLCRCMLHALVCYTLHNTQTMRVLCMGVSRQHTNNARIVYGILCVCLVFKAGSSLAETACFLSSLHAELHPTLLTLQQTTS